MCPAASSRARSRDLLAGPAQPQTQRATAKEPRSVVVASWPFPTSGTAGV